MLFKTTTSKNNATNLFSCIFACCSLICSKCKSICISTDTKIQLNSISHGFLLWIMMCANATERKSPRKAKTKKHKNVQRMHLLDGQRICTVQIAYVISMSRYFATIKNRCHLPSRRLVHILILLHYRLLHLILLVSLSFFRCVYTMFLF